MNESPSQGHGTSSQPVLAQTEILDSLIRETISRLERQTAVEPANAMLFLGNAHQAFPSLIVRDPVLAPVDKIVWMVICQSGRGTGAVSVFPSHATIARLANVSSKSTVSRAIALLRVTRWITLCANVRDNAGRFRGNVYALHDEPLPLPDALYLDAGYMSFLEKTSANHHARVQRVASGVLESIEQDMERGNDVLAPEDLVERRLCAVRVADRGERKGYFSFTEAVMAKLSNEAATHGETSQHQNLVTVRDQHQNLPHQNLDTDVCSSSYIYKTTTTTAPTKSDKDALVLPRSLEANQRSIAERYVAQLPVAIRQRVLDELDGRIRAVGQGAQPLYDPVRYLHALCLKVKRGEFEPNLGVAVEKERRCRAEPTAAEPPAQAVDATVMQDRDRTVAAQAISTMRKALGRDFDNDKSSG